MTTSHEPIDMVNLEELVQQAKTLPIDNRKEILMSFPELELQQHLKELFKAMEPSYTVEVTQGGPVSMVKTSF